MENNTEGPRPATVFPNGRDVAAKAQEAHDINTTATRKLTEIVQPAVGRVVGGLSRGANALQGAVVSGVGVCSDKLVDTQDQLLEDTRVLICARPMAALGVAFATGLMLSLILSRR